MTKNHPHIHHLEAGLFLESQAYLLLLLVAENVPIRFFLNLKKEPVLR
jgi:hypothetical protein